MEDPLDQVTAAVADVGERLGEYADVWRSAVDRNGRGAYAAEDYLVDLQALWGMSVRDAARIGSAFVEALAPLLPRDPVADPPGNGAEDSRGSAQQG
ncbi:hypothetical protein BH18ACT1_BH18ACT1_12600 [soil metagenome]|nr:hypothetical protein [Acidimicrobiia bacterium]